MIERAKIQSIIDRLKKNSGIDKSFCDDFEKSYNSQSLVIGVVGRMKAGKSSLVNAMVFEDEILPSAVKTSTVTLTEITYSEEERTIVEFISSQDVEDLKKQAAYTGDDDRLKQKAKTASETLDCFKSGYEKYLNKSKQINLEELPKYVDAEGEYSGLAKTVKIFNNSEKLKGITIIDTPGFNDPIASRGETTQKALSKCHVILFVHNEVGYDEDDKDLLVEQIEYAGISEIIDILNKVDMYGAPIANWPDELDYFIQTRDEMDMPNSNVKNLLANAHSTFVSSLMALCGLIPYDKMSEDMKCHYSSYEEEFEEELSQESTRELQQQAFVNYSNVNTVIAEINRLSKEGSIYLVEGPLMTLKGKLLSIKKIKEAELESKRASLAALEVSIDKSEEGRRIFRNFMDEVLSKARSSSLALNLSQLVTASIREAQNLRETNCSKEFSEEAYPDPSFGSSGVGKANIANYNTFVRGFENTLRDLQEKLKDSLETQIKNEVNSLVTNLAETSHIDQNERKEFQSTLNNSLLTIIQRINIVVPSKQLESIPEGNRKQWDKLRTYFLDSYNDKYLTDEKEGIYTRFLTIEQQIDYSQITNEKLHELHKRKDDNLKKTPQQKREEKEDIEKDIKSLEEEIATITKDITSIEELAKNVKSNG